MGVVITNGQKKNAPITVILPTKNEAEGIRQIIDSVRPYCNEILVIDGHSTDNTVEIARAAGVNVYFDDKKGKGNAYQVGIKKASGDILVFLDADGSHEVADIPALVEPLILDEADLVIASRHKGGSDEWKGDLQTYLRAIGSGFLSICINWRWQSNLTDVLNGYRATRRKTALKVPMKAHNFDIEQHMIVQYLKHGYRVREVRSHEYARKWGKSKLPTFRKAYLFFGRLFLDLISGKGKVKEP